MIRHTPGSNQARRHRSIDLAPPAIPDSATWFWVSAQVFEFEDLAVKVPVQGTYIARLSWPAPKLSRRQKRIARRRFRAFVLQ